MTPAEILTLAKLYAHTTDTEVDPDDVNLVNSYLLLNTVINKITNRIITDIDESYLYEIWHTTAEADRANGEYLLPIEGTDGLGAYVAGLSKVENVYVKYKYDATRIYKDHVKCKEVDPSKLTYDWSYYVESQSQGDPLYYISDKSVFIAPEFVSADLGADPNYQIKITGVRTMKELDIDDADDANIIFIPRQYHWLIARGWVSEFMQTRLRDGEENDATALFLREIENMVVDLGSRTIAPDESYLPYDENLQY
jgi:hypothetical protein